MATKNESGAKTPRSTKQVTASVAVQSVKALQAVTKALQNLEDTVASINALPNVVETMQEDLSLGHDAFLVELSEKKAAKIAEMDAILASKEAVIAEKEAEVNSLDDFYQEKESGLRKQLVRTKEEAEYDNKIAIRESKLETARSIANSHNHVVIPNSEYILLEATKSSNEQDIADAIKKAETSAKIGYNAEVANIKNSNALIVKDLEGKLESALDKVYRLEAEVVYFKNEIRDARETSAKTIQSLKSDVTVNNNGK